MNLDAEINAALAERYLWFCQFGWKRPTLNDPKVIWGTATPQDIDNLIVADMKRWQRQPADHIPPTPPLQAA